MPPLSPLHSSLDSHSQSCHLSPPSSLGLSLPSSLPFALKINKTSPCCIVLHIFTIPHDPMLLPFSSSCHPCPPSPPLPSLTLTLPLSCLAPDLLHPLSVPSLAPSLSSPLPLPSHLHSSLTSTSALTFLPIQIPYRHMISRRVVRRWRLLARGGKALLAGEATGRNRLLWRSLQGWQAHSSHAERSRVSCTRARLHELTYLWAR